jgi:micrococcal nuclease
VIASIPVRLASLVIVALAGFVGVRAIIGGLAVDGDLLNTQPSDLGSTDSGRRTAGVVDYVLDGDTIQVTTRDGRELQVRILGLSAPEIPRPGKSGECYGKASKRHLKKLLPADTHVTLESDPTQDDVDTYGRSLRYVRAAGRDIGAAQIQSGAATARDSANPSSRHSTYAQLEDQARAQGAGMWSACQ